MTIKKRHIPAMKASIEDFKMYRRQVVPTNVFENKNIEEMKMGKRFFRNNTYLSNIDRYEVGYSEIPFSLDFPSEYKDIYSWVDTNEYSQEYNFDDFYEAYENLKRFIGPGVNIEFTNNKLMYKEDYTRARENRAGPYQVYYVSNDGEDFRTYIHNDEYRKLKDQFDIKEVSISPSLSSVLTPEKEEDSDLFMNIPDMDANILKQYMNGSDESRKTIFFKSRKTTIFE